jgi:hypothetical protein
MAAIRRMRTPQPGQRSASTSKTRWSSAAQASRRAGVAGVDGNSIAGTREQVLGIGPGAVWHFSPNNHLFANFYFETVAENRPEGKIRLNLRWTHHF